MTLLRTTLALLVAGCTTTEIIDDDPSVDTGGDDLPETQGGSQGGDGSGPGETPPVPLVADMCDEAAHPGVTWQSTTTAHFTLSYLPGTTPATDSADIATRLEGAYTNITQALGVASTPRLTVNLSPSRNAAVAHNRGFGRVWPHLSRYDVIYTGMADSFEMQRYGELLTRMVDYHIDPNNRYRLYMLTMGLAGYLDQSGRDMHDAYAKLLLAGEESRVRLAELDDGDVYANNPGRAGSLVQFMIDRYGMESFMTMYKATNVSWNGTCDFHATYGCMDTPNQMTSMLDGVLFAETGEHWYEMQPAWQAEVEAALERAPLGMGRTIDAEISNLVRTMDLAITEDDAALYRTTIEGFYCDWGGDNVRNQISARAVAAYGAIQTQILGIYDTGIKNFQTAQAFVMRTDDNGIPTFATIQFEHMPVGWRVSYSPDWY